MKVQVHRGRLRRLLQKSPFVRKEKGPEVAPHGVFDAQGRRDYGFNIPEG
jgi:hypothetical protein